MKSIPYTKTAKPAQSLLSISSVSKAQEILRMQKNVSMSWFRSARRMRAAGFTLIEAMIVLAIIGVGAALAVSNLGPMMRASRATTMARDLADLITLARSEAIRDGVNHVVLFNNASLPAGVIVPGMAVRFRDDNGDCVPASTEIQGLIRWSADVDFGLLHFPSMFERAPYDTGPGSLSGRGSTFVSTGGTQHWYGLVFTPDGLPRSFTMNGSGTPATIGGVGTGRGAVYIEIENPLRFYAIQVSGGGAVVVSRYGGGAWK